ncbi:hypothetical protein M0804_012346 [Polistes exclamans]|nr:hypothetical protein M0804_012346 [Polistes exclamans]
MELHRMAHFLVLLLFIFPYNALGASNYPDYSSDEKENPSEETKFLFTLQSKINMRPYYDVSLVGNYYRPYPPIDK